MQSRTGFFILTFVALGAFQIGGCPPAAVVGFTIASRVFTFVLEQSGILDVQANASVPARSAAVVSLPFDGTPTDQPASASLRVGTVRAIPLDSTSKPTAQALTGVAIVNVSFDGPGSANPCNDGIAVGAFEVRIVSGVASVEDDTLAVPAAALPFVIQGTFSICLEITSNVDVRIVIEDMSIAFGAASGASNSNGSNNTNSGPITTPDTTPPTITFCPSDQERETDESGMFALPTFDVEAEDDRGGRLTFTQTPPAGTLVGVGTTTVTTVVADGAGNEATCTIDLTVNEAEPMNDGFVAASIVHRGSERILAGSEIDANFGLITDANYTVEPILFDVFSKSYALSGDGNYIWFRLVRISSAEGQDRTQIWRMRTDGTGATRVAIPSDQTTTFGAHLEIDEDGDVCIVGMGGKFLRSVNAQPLQTLFEYAGENDFRSAYKVNDAGSRFWALDINKLEVHTVNLASPGMSSVAVTREMTAINGRLPRALGSQEFDLAGIAGSFVFRWNYDLGSTVPTAERFQDVFWRGGAGAPMNYLQSIAGSTSPYDLNISDDGQTIGYCRNVDNLPGIDPPVPCFVESLAGGVTQVGDGRTRMGGFLMSDDASRVFYVDSASFGGSNAILEDVGSGRKVAAGTPAFAPQWDGEFVRVDDSGQTFAAWCLSGGGRGGLYLLHDGATGLAGFPQIDGISYRFEDECRVRVRVRAQGPRGIGRMFLMPLNDGVNPTKFVPGEENPLYFIRGTTTNRFAELEETPGTWEFTFELKNSEGNCARDQLTGAFTLRVVVEDANETLAVFEEFALVP
ncbi:MAG: HYR domain-containing protein [Phycisphaerae bacterium]